MIYCLNLVNIAVITVILVMQWRLEDANSRSFKFVCYGSILLPIADLCRPFVFELQLVHIYGVCEGLYLESIYIMCYSWLLFFIRLVDDSETESNFFIFLKQTGVFGLILGIMIAIVSLFSPIFFSFDQSHNMVHGPLFFVVLVLGLYYVIGVLIVCVSKFIEGSYLSKQFAVIIALLTCLNYLASVFQYITQLSLLPTITTFAILLFFFNNQERRISSDPLTHLNNRTSLQNYYDSLQFDNEQSDYYLIFFDVNSFKHINDNYGHVEGDHALLIITNALNDLQQQSDRQVFNCRYSGDEFVVILKAKQEVQVQQYIIELENKLKTLCLVDKIKYIISVSSGYMHIPTSREPLGSVVNVAEANMYNERAALRFGTHYER